VQNSATMTAAAAIGGAGVVAVLAVNGVAEELPGNSLIGVFAVAFNAFNNHLLSIKGNEDIIEEFSARGPRIRDMVPLKVSLDLQKTSRL
jgi:hypothetical protein